MAGKVIEYPFDTVKVRLQSQPHDRILYHGPLDCFRKSFRADGLAGLYRGISAPMAGAAIENSCLFFSYRIVQDVLRVGFYSSTTDTLPFSALLVSGAASGSITSLALTPIELIKCKMQVPTDGSKPPGPLKLIGSVFRQDGLLGFWRGQLGTLIRETGGGAAWFGGYEGVTHLFREYTASRNPEQHQKQHSIPIYQQMIAGATAGISYNFLFYPADTIKSRMQTEDVGVRGPAADSERRSFWNVGKTLWRQQGLRGMYRGCGITCGRSAPSSAFIFTVYEGLRSYFG